MIGSIHTYSFNDSRNGPTTILFFISSSSVLVIPASPSLTSRLSKVLIVEIVQMVS
ncbi:hypothetical protein PDIG_32390 [Penicillium digitatum PHI26]|uniref:Uncharacterized protein n=2 Tax=Penicillium digitatum TaxID=36651 RepID=K9FXS0_PEND2|nr:hypothetical protein PDIP_51980 [Penicillium digitatum Pd1]EKV12611.1 hypothetical protein PDIP_51980 [Penicillium digitatum Pd1]EKV14525.1 hypothetical protein PDIG_32390 [Penicillium digitatum PHI26]